MSKNATLLLLVWLIGLVIEYRTTVKHIDQIRKLPGYIGDRNAKILLVFVCLFWPVTMAWSLAKQLTR